MQIDGETIEAVTDFIFLVIDILNLSPKFQPLYPPCLGLLSFFRLLRLILQRVGLGLPWACHREPGLLERRCPGCHLFQVLWKSQKLKVSRAGKEWFGGGSLRTTLEQAVWGASLVRGGGGAKAGPPKGPVSAPPSPVPPSSSQRGSPRGISFKGELDAGAISGCSLFAQWTKHCWHLGVD